MSKTESIPFSCQGAGFRSWGSCRSQGISQTGFKIFLETIHQDFKDRYKLNKGIKEKVIY
jgi:hypothetical protein